MTGGYTVERRKFGLRFRDGRHEGCVVKVMAMTIDDLMLLNGAIPDLDLSGAMTPGMTRNLPLLMDEFMDYATEWNLREEDGTEIPCTRAGLGTLEIPFVVELISAWLPASAGIEPDLGKDSSSGDPSPELSIPMEPPSPSLTS